MRILHVVPVVTANFEFGGPVRVAANTCRQLIEMGHDVLMVGGCEGYAEIPDEVDGIPVRLFPIRRIYPRRGYGGIVSGRALRYIWNHANEFDVAHVHVQRDFLTMPALRILQKRGCSTVAQPHGMIVPDKRIAARALDLIETRGGLRKAGAVLCLTGRERNELTQIVGPANYVDLPNGISITDVDRTVMTPPEVLYVGRLERNKRPELFVEAARRALESGLLARFSLVGPDQGLGGAVKEAITQSGFEESIMWEGAISPDRIQQRMARASCVVQPSDSESFGMAILEAMSIGIPVVVTEGVALAEFVERFRCGIVVKRRDPSAIAHAVSRILQNDREASNMSRNAMTGVMDHFGIDRVTGRLVDTYERLSNVAYR